MKVLMTLMLIILSSQTVVLDAFSEDASQETLNNTLQRQREAQYLQKVEKTRQMQKKALEFNEKKYGIGSIETLKSLEALAWINMELYDFKGAEKLYQRAIELRREQLPLTDENMQKLGKLYFMVGDAYLYLNYNSLAITSYDESISLITDPVHRGDALSRKGIIYEGEKDYEKALVFYLDSLKEYESAKLLYPRSERPLNKSILRVYKRMPELLQLVGENLEANKYQRLIKEMEENIRGGQEGENEL